MCEATGRGSEAGLAGTGRRVAPQPTTDCPVYKTDYTLYEQTSSGRQINDGKGGGGG